MTAEKLFKWHAVAGLLHLFSAVTIFFITDKDAKVPIYTVYGDSERIGGMWGIDVQKRGEVIVGYLSTIFLFLAFSNHMISILMKKYYVENMEKGRNIIRWIEYSISASVMHVMTSLLCGIMDMWALVMIFGLTATTMVFAIIADLLADDTKAADHNKSIRLLSFYLGCVPHVVNWTVIIYNFMYQTINSNPPTFVYYIIYIEFVLDFSFAVVYILSIYKVGIWKDSVSVEMSFIVLSLTSKTLLAWLNWGGTNAL